MVFMATSPSSPIFAAKTDGKGDVTSTHTVWTQSRNVPMTGSFLYVKPCLYAPGDNNTFAALEPATGEILWTRRFEGKLDSSPVYADGMIYVTTDDGTTTVLKLNADPKVAPEVIAVNEIDERVQATLAIAGKQIFLRTAKELWCIGK